MQNRLYLVLALLALAAACSSTDSDQVVTGSSSSTTSISVPPPTEFVVPATVARPTPPTAPDRIENASDDELDLHVRYEWPEDT